MSWEWYHKSRTNNFKYLSLYHLLQAGLLSDVLLLLRCSCPSCSFPIWKRSRSSKIANLFQFSSNLLVHFSPFLQVSTSVKFPYISASYEAVIASLRILNASSKWHERLLHSRWHPPPLLLSILIESKASSLCASWSSLRYVRSTSWQSFVCWLFLVQPGPLVSVCPRCGLCGLERMLIGDSRVFGGRMRYNFKTCDPADPNTSYDKFINDPKPGHVEDHDPTTGLTSFAVVRRHVNADADKFLNHLVNGDALTMWLRADLFGRTMV